MEVLEQLHIFHTSDRSGKTPLAHYIQNPQ